ncbi:MAG: TonB-dependent receptor [Gammaproteobacteria bacterium]|nr:TonB-dependent receptor [Gammaproteobacteria bacterium]
MNLNISIVTIFFRWVTGLLGGCVLVTFSVYAETPDSPTQVTEQDILSDIPTVLSASRMPQPVSEAPAAITIIDSEMIEASGARNLVDVFRLVPGFVTANFDGNRAVVSPYGLSDVYSRRIQVLIDGRSVYSPDYGGVIWSDLPLALEEIDKIEVVRGPNAASYGANSFLGVINIITKPAAVSDGVRIKYTYGRQNTQDSLLQYGYAGKRADYRVTLGYQKDSGFEDLFDSRRTSFFNSRIDYRLSNNNTINVYAGALGGEIGEGKEGDAKDIPRDEHVLSNYQQVRWTYISENSGEYSLQYFRNYHDSRDSFVNAYGLYPVVLWDYDITSERHDLEFQHQVGFGSFLRLAWGVNGRIDSVTGEKIFNSNSDLESRLSRAFVNSEWHVGRDLLFHFGTVVERTTITDTEFSPRTAVNYHITPLHTIRASYSESTRNPTLVEEKAEIRICAISSDPSCTAIGSYFVASRSRGGLNPERIASRDIGYYGQITNSLQLDIRLSRKKLKYLIDWTLDNYPDALDVLGYSNRDVTDILEIAELQSTYSLDSNSKLAISYAYMDFEGGRYPEANKRFYTPSVPRQMASLLAVHNFGQGYKGSIGYYLLDRIRHLDTEDSTDTSLDPRRQLDLRLSRQFMLAGSEATISCVLQNVLDDYYEYQETDRKPISARYYVTLAMKFW